jgi:FtsP/CotA-like multicopper oxidase with cupredoxin domain
MKDSLARPAVRLCLALLCTAGILGPVGVMWVQSLVPSTYSVMDMGYADYGGGPQPAGGHADHSGAAGVGARAGAASAPAAGEVSVAELRGPRSGPAEVVVTLVARKEQLRLSSGERVPGYTLNHASPGPMIRATQGDLVQVTLVNDNVPDGVTLHWHGIDVPNGEDGVAGVTQNAVPVGGKHVYRFVAEDAGTYWYHSHQVSHEQVRRGLFGAFVINGGSGREHVSLPGGTRLRVRVVNTNNGPFHTWVTGTSYSVLAVDGFDLNDPPLVRNRSLLLAGGGRADLSLTTPEDGSVVRIDVGGGATHLTIGASRDLPPATRQPEHQVDLLTYGSPKRLAFDPDQADRRFEYRIGRRPGFIDGRPGFWWSVNGKLFPEVPMYVVAAGDIVRMTLKNTSGDVHPMHLHGHHAVVLSRNGKRSTGSPWWVDSLNVKDGETYEIAFVADNPGIWMDHCHNLPHAAEGLMAHLVYAGVTEPFKIGGKGDNHPHNHPE